VQVASGVVETAKSAMSAECSRSDVKRGHVVVVSGPMCQHLQRQLEDRLADLKRVSDDRGATATMTSLEFAADGKKRELDALGLPDKEVDTPKVRGIALWLLNRGLIEQSRAMSFSSDMPETAGITYELLAWIFPPIWFALMFRAFGMMVCTKTEAEKLIHETSMQVAADYAERAAAELETDEQPAPKTVEPPVRGPVGWGQPKPEVNHAEVLGIEEPDPAFVASPQNAEEAIAAEFIKAVKPKREPRARRLTEGGVSSAIQHFKERAFWQNGMVTNSKTAYPDYERWCEDRNLIPLGIIAYGKALEAHCNVRKERTKGGTKYHNMGLRPAHIRVVA